MNNTWVSQRGINQIIGHLHQKTNRWWLADFHTFDWILDNLCCLVDDAHLAVVRAAHCSVVCGSLWGSKKPTKTLRPWTQSVSNALSVWDWDDSTFAPLLLWVCSLHQGKDLFSRLRTGYLPAKRPCEWDWDAAAQRPRQRPRLDYVPQLIWNRSCLQASKEQRRG